MKLMLWAHSQVPRPSIFSVYLSLWPQALADDLELPPECWDVNTFGQHHIFLVPIKPPRASETLTYWKYLYSEILNLLETHFPERGDRA